MTKYEIIFESIQNQVETGELTMEDAEVLNSLAYEKYGNDNTEYEEVTESSEDEAVTYEEYLESIEEELFGEATRLAKEIHKDHNNINRQLQEHQQQKNTLKPFSPLWMKAQTDDMALKLDKQHIDSVDSIQYGRDVHRNDKEIKNIQKKRQGIERKYNQKKIFDTEPSYNSLENRPAGRFIKK